MRASQEPTTRGAKTKLHETCIAHAKRLKAELDQREEKVRELEEWMEKLALRLDHVSGVARDLGHHQYDGCEWCRDSKNLIAEARAVLKGAKP